jgi:hypothetical protein
MRPGYRTTEFWTTLISQGLALLTIVGLLTAKEASTLQDALGQCVAAVFLFLTNGWVVVRYIQARVAVKTARPEAAPGGSPSVLPFLLAAVVLGTMGSSAQAQLPWRRQMEQRLRNLEQNQRTPPAPAPAAPPQIIFLPYQQLPIAGEPKQQLPIPGDPRQQLPVPGNPQQQLPVPGSPQQPLPIQGPPRQPLPGAADGPRPYTSWALWKKG